MPAPKIDPDDGFVDAPALNPRTRPVDPPQTPGPKYPANTPVANPTHVGDAPYTTPKPKLPPRQ